MRRSQNKRGRIASTRATTHAIQSQANPRRYIDVHLRYAGSGVGYLGIVFIYRRGTSCSLQLRAPAAVVGLAILQVGFADSPCTWCLLE